MLTNLETKVDVTVWKTLHRDVSLLLVVFLSVLAGIVYAGVIAVAEGANLRIANHRLQREVQKLETELNYLRTQPIAPPRAEPDSLQEAPWSPRPRQGEPADEQDAPPASAPVYDAESAWEDDREDGGYTGGRAV
jgi:hypothetical protein